MLFQTCKNFIFPFILGRYLQLEGKWLYVSSSSISISERFLLDAKRACLDNGMCFGIGVDVNYGNPYLLEFPVFIRPGEGFYIHQKETITGIFIYKKRYRNINSLFMICIESL